MHTARGMPPRRQRGAVLVVGLITLVVLTIIGLHASRSATMGMVAATNAQESAVALAAAEDSASIGERQTLALYGGSFPGDLSDNAADGYYEEGTVDLNTLDWTQANGIERVYAVDGTLLAEYVVEYLGEGESAGESITLGGATVKSQLYRISGRGVGARGTERIVQTIFGAQE